MLKLDVNTINSQSKKAYDRFNNRNQTGYTTNFLKKDNLVPDKIRISNSSIDDILSYSEKKSDIQKRVNNFQALVKSINNTAGFSELAKDSISKEMELLESIKNKFEESLFATDSVVRNSVKSDIGSLIKEIDKISDKTKFHNTQILDGTFKYRDSFINTPSNRIGESILKSSKSKDLGNISYLTTANISNSGTTSLKIFNSAKYLDISNVKIGYQEGQGLGTLAKIINAEKDNTGVSASYKVLYTSRNSIESGTIKNLNINGVNLGDFTITENQNVNKLISFINNFQNESGVKSYIDSQGRFNLESIDGRGIKVQADSGLSTISDSFNVDTTTTSTTSSNFSFEAPYEFLNSDISAGFEINGVEINNSDMNLYTFVDEINAKTDQTGVSVKIGSNGKLTFTTTNSDNLNDGYIDFNFQSVNDAYVLGFEKEVVSTTPTTTTFSWKAKDLSSGTAIDFSNTSSNLLYLNGTNININDKTNSEIVTLINKNTKKTGISASLTADSEVLVTSSNSSSINLSLSDTTDYKNLGLDATSYDDSSQVYVDSLYKLNLEDVALMKGFSISSKNDINSFVTIIDDPNTLIWSQNTQAPDGYLDIDDVVNLINAKSNLTGVVASIQGSNQVMKLDKTGNVGSKDFKISENIVSPEDFANNYLIDANGDVIEVVSIPDTLLDTYSTTTNSFNYSVAIKEGSTTTSTTSKSTEFFEDYGKLTLSANGVNKLNITASNSTMSSYFDNSLKKIVNMSDLKENLSFSDLDAVGLFANENLKTNLYKESFEFKSNFKSVYDDVLDTTHQDLSELMESLDTIHTTLTSSLKLIENFVDTLSDKVTETSDIKENLKKIYERDAFFPMIGTTVTHKRQTDLQNRALKLLFHFHI